MFLYYNIYRQFIVLRRQWYHPLERKYRIQRHYTLFALRILLRLGSRVRFTNSANRSRDVCCNICTVAFSEYEQTRISLNYSWMRVHTAIRNVSTFFFPSYDFATNERRRVASHRIPQKSDLTTVRHAKYKRMSDRHLHLA